MADCKNCEHAIFDEIWGEYKCKVFKRRIYEPEKVSCTASKKKGKEEDKK